MSEPAFLPTKAHQHLFYQSVKSAPRQGPGSSESNWKESASLQQQQQQRQQKQPKEEPQQQHHRPQQQLRHAALLSPALLSSSTSPSKSTSRPRRQLQPQQAQVQGSLSQRRLNPIDKTLEATATTLDPPSTTRLLSRGESVSVQRGSGLARKRSTSNSSTSTTSVSYLRSAASAVIATAHRTHFRHNNRNNNNNVGITHNMSDINRLSQDGREDDDDLNSHRSNNDKLSLCHRPAENSSGGDLGSLIGYRSKDPRGHHAHVPSISPPIQFDPEGHIQERGMWEQYRYRASVPFGVEAQSQWQYAIPSMDLGSFSSRGDPKTPLFLTDPYIPLDLAAIHAESSRRSNWSNSTHCEQEQAPDGSVPTHIHHRYPLPAHPQGNDAVGTIENLDDTESYVSEADSKERRAAERHQDMHRALFPSSGNLDEYQQQAHPYPVVAAPAETQEDDGDREVLEVYRRRQNPLRPIEQYGGELLALEDSTPWPTLHQSSSDMEIDMLMNNNDSTQQDLSLLNTLAQLEEEVGRLRGVNRELQSALDQCRQHNDMIEQDYEQKLQAIQKQHEEMVTDMKNQLKRQHDQEIQDHQHQESQRVAVLQSTLKTQLTALRNLHRETRDQHRQAEADLSLLLDYLKNTLSPSWIHFCNTSSQKGGYQESPKSAWSMNQVSHFTTDRQDRKVQEEALDKSLALTGDMACKTTTGQSCWLILQQLDRGINDIIPLVADADPLTFDSIQPQARQWKEGTGESGVNLLKRRRQQHKRLSDSSASSGKTIVATHLAVGTATTATTAAASPDPPSSATKAGQIQQALATLHCVGDMRAMEGGRLPTENDLLNFKQEKEYFLQCLTDLQADHQLEIENIKQQCIRLYRESLHEVRAELMDKMQHKRLQKRRG
ncbi:hypothetical protein EMPS_09159 [Entomortierella parvispora]|uniref:Uncharacterized protein n=1 Tax=Entomortierella parvispora TaxID=205924 RepID=A0A9P3HHH9_9FUNG|nr:hypothetical protein EMPS_09159 [Entomortierella parvispora]